MRVLYRRTPGGWESGPSPPFRPPWNPLEPKKLSSPALCAGKRCGFSPIQLVNFQEILPRNHLSPWVAMGVRPHSRRDGWAASDLGDPPNVFITVVVGWPTTDKVQIGFWDGRFYENGGGLDWAWQGRWALRQTQFLAILVTWRSLYRGWSPDPP